MSPRRRALLGDDVAALLYVSTILARRLDSANEVIVEIKRSWNPANVLGQSPSAEKAGELLSPAGNAPDFTYYPFFELFSRERPFECHFSVVRSRQGGDFADFGYRATTWKIGQSEGEIDSWLCGI